MINQRQAFYPWPNLLRKFGFKKSYLLKDLFFYKKLSQLNIPPEGKVLDVGCGQGVFLDRLAQTYRVKGTGIDISPRAIRQAKKQSRAGKFIMADAVRLPFKDQSFDLVFSLDSLEHIKPQVKALKEMLRVLKPGGILFIYAVFQNRSFTFNQLRSCFFKFFGLDLDQKFGHHPALYLREEKIKKLAQQGQIQILSMKPFHSFFTNLFDFLLLMNLFFILKLGFFRSEKFGKMGLTLIDRLCRLAYCPLLVLDWPWRLIGQGNGLLFIGRKNEKT